MLYMKWLYVNVDNVSDCAGRGVPVFDPWTGELHM